MKTKDIKPLDSYVLVEKREVTSSSIFDLANETQYWVIAIGELVDSVKPGDRVVLTRADGEIKSDEGDELFLVDYTTILAKYE